MIITATIVLINMPINMITHLGKEHVDHGIQIHDRYNNGSFKVGIRGISYR